MEETAYIAIMPRGRDDRVVLLESLVAHAPVPMQVYGLDGRCALVNAAFRELFGTEPPADYNVLTDDVLTRAGLMPLVRRAFAGETVVTPAAWYDARALAVPTVEGRRVAVESTMFPLPAGDGRLAYIGVTFRDVTAEMEQREAQTKLRRIEAKEQRRAAEALRHSEEHLRLALAAGGMVAVDIDFATGRVVLSENGSAVLGLLPGRRVSTVRELLDLVHPDDAAAITEAMVRAPGSEAMEDMQFRLVRADNRETIWLESLSEARRDDDGRVIGARGLLMDVTSRKSAERQVLESRAQWRALVEHAPDVVLNVDLDGRILFYNRALAGTGGSEVIGSVLVEQLVPEHQTQLQRALDRVFDGGRPGTCEFMTRTAEGASTWYSAHVGPVRREGRVAGAVVIARDITQKKQTEAQLLVADRMASVGTLAAGVAHEINNPLAAVIANVDLALLQLDELAGAVEIPVELFDELHDVRDAADRVREIVRDLKLFSTSADERRGPVDVSRVIESTVRMAWNEIRHRAKFVRDYGATPPVWANEARLGQVFLNLIVNAAQAIEEGHADANVIRISSGLDAEGRVWVTVSDTGRGIPAEVQPRLFTPFFTTKPLGEGSGLGLSICHRILTALGGDISFTSELGRGTEFRVLLPVADPAQPRGREPSQPVQAAGRRGRVLVVDDEPLITQAVTRTLSPVHDVTAVNGAHEALDLLGRGGSFDVILCDLMMPQMTGMDLFDALVRDLPEQAERVVFLTGGAFTHRAREFLATVPNPRIDKPFDARGLRSVVDEAVAKVPR